MTSPEARAAQQWLDAQPTDQSPEIEFDPNRRRWGLALVVVAVLTLAAYLFVPFPSDGLSTVSNTHAVAFLGGCVCFAAGGILAFALLRSRRRRHAMQGLDRAEDEPALTDQQLRRVRKQIASRLPSSEAERPYVTLTARRRRSSGRESVLAALIGVLAAAGYALLAGSVWPAGLVLGLMAVSAIRGRRHRQTTDSYLRNASREAGGLIEI